MFLTEKIMGNYSGLYQGLSGYYMVFMNYIAALMLTRKISGCDMKTRPSKVKDLIWKIFPHQPLYHTVTKKPERVICGTKVTDGPETPESPQW